MKVNVMPLTVFQSNKLNHQHYNVYFCTAPPKYTYIVTYNFFFFVIIFLLGSFTSIDKYRWIYSS